MTGLAATGLAFGGYVFFTIYHLGVEQVADDLYVLYGAGGNVAVLDTEEGAVVVDTMTLAYQGDRIQQVALELTGKPVIMIINTHYHLDHTHGNPAFPAGTRVVATDRTLHHLITTDIATFAGEAAALLPNETFVDQTRLTVGEYHLTLVKPGQGHTDGDLVVLFEEQRILHAGDLFFNGHYPNIDLEAGGSVRDWPETIDVVMNLPFDGVIPGHGRFSDRAGFRQYQQFISQLGELAAEAVAAGESQDEFVATAALTEDAGYSEIRMLVPIGLDRPFVLGRAYEEAAGLVSARP
ncbi:MAG: MBL fold metallo-hydrolase [Pseudomonadota bacterium]